MALTPEDVVNKRFQQTKFREGYDQDEVDDFLDEIVIELRRLIAENEELRAELDAAAKRVASAPQPVLEKVVEEPAPVQQPTPQPVASLGAAASGDDAESSNSLLVLARRLHDEHVADGARRKDEIIAEGEAEARRIVADAELRARNVVNEGDAKARQIVSDAEAKERDTMRRLEDSKTKIEERIEELRIFERDYRNQLRGYIEGQLNDLNRQASGVEPAASGVQQPQQ
ncbi:DivIVA domain-containing protein [Pseudoclavibacter chungangensis]|uniref:Cell wall synthesis protein Wag31 n=1 Tax=Pseudoclavibacter chungangensis TaxID=587635 RepID=A0A7J5BZN1_9MICO|nr:DivIVA domain-containing protein [Pseudoclavibacter chungangensis]KAB1660115.1 DivIVA domain-containing protein [Pseudoclavibacter chungangensis]NYJ66780.1 DivIVA domain-containing protein [Pseudoclavibacter chungangensis]